MSQQLPNCDKDSKNVACTGNGLNGDVQCLSKVHQVESVHAKKAQAKKVQEKKAQAKKVQAKKVQAKKVEPAPSGLVNDVEEVVGSVVGGAVDGVDTVVSGSENVVEGVASDVGSVAGRSSSKVLGYLFGWPTQSHR